MFLDVLVILPKICHSFNSRRVMEVGGGGGGRDEKKPGLDEGMGGRESVYTCMGHLMLLQAESLYKRNSNEITDANSFLI